MKFPYKAPYPRDVLSRWIAASMPLQIEMDDSQYSWLSSLEKVCKKDVGGIPIVFTDAPHSIA